MSVEVSALGGRPDIVDQFGRTVASGWGTADTGQAWVPGGAGTEYSVSSGRGVMDFGGVATRTCHLAMAHSDVDVTVDISLPVTPTGGDVTLSLLLRRSASASTDYRVQFGFTTAGNVSASLLRFMSGASASLGSVLPPTTYTPGTVYRVRFRCIGSTLQAKAWLATAAEPATWAQSVVDTNTPSGERVMLAAVPSPGNTSSDPRALFDNFSCRALYPNVVDSFSRTVAAGGWGAADSGHGWVLTGTASNFSVSGGFGRLATTTNTSQNAYVAFAHYDVDATVDLGVAQVATGDLIIGAIRLRSDSGLTNNYTLQGAFRTNGQVDFDLIRNSGGNNISNDFAVLPYTAGQMFRVRFQCVGSTIRAKVWALPGSEPASWQVSVTDSNVASGTHVALNVFRASGNTSTDPTVLFDNFFVRPLRPAINDSFDRTVASGWGNLTSGQAWINSDTAVMSVGSGKGVMTPAAGSTVVAALASPSPDVEVRVVVDVAQTPSTANAEAYLTARSSATTVGNSYHVRPVFRTNGTAAVSLLKFNPGTTVLASLFDTAYTPGTGINLRLRCVGSKIMGKAWIVGQSEPAWTEVSDTDLVSAGFVRLSGVRIAGNTSANPNILFDDFQVIDLSRPLKLDTGVTSIDPSRLVTI
jgi:hypothetical protein